MEIILNPPNSPILFSNSYFEVRFYGLFMSLSILTGILGAYNLFKQKYSLNLADKFIDNSIYIILFSIVGARLFYVLGNLKYYLNNPKEIILLNHGGISIWGAIIFGIISVYYFSKKNAFSCFKSFDVLAVFMPICQAIGRFGNYFNQEAFGLPSNGPIKLIVDKSFRPDIYKDILYFHPTFLYELVLNMFLFITLFLLFKKNKLKDGSIFCFYLIGYSIIRFIIEPIRIDSTLNIFNIPIAQIISLAVFVFAICVYIKIKKTD